MELVLVHIRKEAGDQQDFAILKAGGGGRFEAGVGVKRKIIIHAGNFGAGAVGGNLRERGGFRSGGNPGFKLVQGGKALHVRSMNAKGESCEREGYRKKSVEFQEARPPGGKGHRRSW
jgi:hypothetical protein